MKTLTHKIRADELSMQRNGCIMDPWVIKNSLCQEKNKWNKRNVVQLTGSKILNILRISSFVHIRDSTKN